MMRIPKPMLIAFSVALLTLSLPSYAAFTVTDTITYNGSTYSLLPSGLPSNGTISPTISYSIGNAFNGGGQMATGADFSNSVATGPGGPWNFQDDYYFSTTGATVQTAVISTALNAVSNLQVR
jgi:hypothetical protein